MTDMKYFWTEQERREHHTSMCFEFQRGTYSQKHWLEDSMVLYADIFDENGLYDIFSGAVPAFAYYGLTAVNGEDWKRLKNAALEHGGVPYEIITELSPWAEDCLKNEGVFTVCGI